MLLHSLNWLALYSAPARPPTSLSHLSSVNRIIVDSAPATVKRIKGTKIPNTFEICTKFVHSRGVYTVNTRSACTILVHALFTTSSQSAIFWRHKPSIPQPLFPVATLRCNSRIFDKSTAYYSQRSEVDQLNGKSIAASPGSVTLLQY